MSDTLRIEFTDDPQDLKCDKTIIRIYKNDNLFKEYKGFPANVCYSMIKDIIEMDYSKCKLGGDMNENNQK